MATEIFNYGIIETMNDEEYAELRNCKKYMKNYLCSDMRFGEYYSPNGGEKNRFYIPLIANCVDNFRLEVVFDETISEILTPADVLKSIDLELQGSAYDMFDKYSLEVALMKNNLVCTQVGNKLTIPLPFDITSGNNVLWLNFFNKPNFHERSLIVCFNRKYKFTANIIGCFYSCEDVTFDNKKKYDLTKILFGSDKTLDFLNIFESHQFNIAQSNGDRYKMFFNLCCRDLYFLVVRDDGTIVREKMFDNFDLFFDNKIVNDYTKEESSGITFIKFNKSHNMSKYDSFCIKFDKNIPKNLSLYVYAITGNFILYCYGIVLQGAYY